MAALTLMPGMAGLPVWRRIYRGDGAVLDDGCWPGVSRSAEVGNARTIRAPRGPEISAKSWLTEAALRMLMNNLDPDVAERPGELVVYGGIGRAARVSLHHGGGVGMGFSQHAGMVVVADGSENATRRLERVLWNDPASGVMRHADAGYEEALACARAMQLRLPGIS